MGAEKQPSAIELQNVMQM